MIVGTRSISLFRPLVREEQIEAAARVLRSGWLGSGPEARALEEAFARYVGAPSCVAVSSGTAAIQLALRALDLPAGAEVVTTPLTFVSANQAILHEGLQPVFADVQPETANLDPASVAERITERTGALLLMHYAGYPCDLDHLYALARERGVPVIEDCAHACGAVYGGRRIGAHDGAELQAFSFDPLKNLTAVDGGALTFRSEGYLERLRRLRSLGVSADSHARAAGGARNWEYEVDELGYRFAINDVAAAIALAGLPFLDSDNARRAELAERYRTALAGVHGIDLLRSDDDRSSAHHLFCVLAEGREGLVDKLAERGIVAGVHYRPSYDFKLFGGEPLPGVESVWRRLVSLPMHLLLDDGDVDYVVETIRSGW